MTIVANSNIVIFAVIKNTWLTKKEKKMSCKRKSVQGLCLCMQNSAQVQDRNEGKTSLDKDVISADSEMDGRRIFTISTVDDQQKEDGFSSDKCYRHRYSS